MNHIVTTVIIYFTMINSVFAGSIQPEMIVRFANGAFVCFNKEELQKAIVYSAKGEQEKLKNIFTQQGGKCFVIPPFSHVKVIRVEPTHLKDIFFLELIGEKENLNDGVWTLSVGAEEVKNRFRKN